MERRRLRNLLILMTLCMLASGCARTHVVLADPEPSYSVTDGYPRVVQEKVEVQAGDQIGEIDSAGLYLIHGRHLRALLERASK